MQLNEDDVAVVTGAASGIGFALSQALLERGLRVVLADVEDVALDDALARLDGGARVIAVRTDVRHADEVDALAQRTIAVFGRVDLVGNIAGVAGPWAASWEQAIPDWQWIIEVNLFGVINGIRAFVPHLIAQGHGHVVNMASVAGLAAVPGGGNGPYTASKYAVVGLSELLRAELDVAAPAVGVTVVCPGRVATRLRESERNRPADRQAGAPRTSRAPDVEIEASVLSASEVGAQIIDAVTSDRLFVIPTGAASELAASRSRRLLAQLGE